MINKIQRDKWKHFFVGIAMGAFLQIALPWLLPVSMVAASGIVVLAVVAISYGFELFSKITGLGHYDVLDALASIIGGFIGMLPVIAFQYNDGAFG